MTRLPGLCAFPITPADEHGRVDAEALRGLLRRLVDAGVDSIGLLGSTGTYAYLSRAERRRAIEAAASELGGRTPLLVGIGALRTDDAVRFGLDAKQAGADAVLLAPVSYTPLTDEEVFTHFETVAKAVALPLCIYNNPGTTHFSFASGLVARLSRLPHVAAVKNPAPADADAIRAQIGELRASCAPGFSLGHSVDWNAVEAMLAGSDCWYSVLAGLLPGPCLDIVAAIRRGDAACARRLHARLQPLWELFTEFGSLRVMVAAANLLGLCRTSPPRPILPLPQGVRQRIRDALDRLGQD